MTTPTEKEVIEALIVVAQDQKNKEVTAHAKRLLAFDKRITDLQAKSASL